MTIQELQTYSVASPGWTKACPVEHRLAATAATAAPAPVGRRVSGAGGRGETRTRPPGRSRGRAGAGGERSAAAAFRSSGPSGAAALRPVAPAGRRDLGVGSTGQRVLGRPPVAARACRVEAPSVAGVVDDVPTWVLAGAGILLGVLMLLVLALVGGPAYA